MTRTLTTSGNTTTYIYTADDTLFARIDPNGTLNVRIGEHWETDGTTTRTNYRYASSLIAVRTQTATTNTLTHVIDDTQGTVSVVHTLGGNTGRVWYDPWGLARATTGTASPTPHGYTGQHHQPSGLIDYQARQYDPGYGRFTSPDTLIPNPTNPQDLNRYAYTRNNPTTNTDPTGHCTVAVGDSCLYTGERPDSTPSTQAWMWMKANIVDERLELVRTGLEASELIKSCFICDGGATAHLTADAAFLLLVRSGGPWDYKDFVRINLQDGDFYSPLEPGGSVEVAYDVWANINYGYVGAYAGYSREELQNAPAAESGVNDRSDEISIDIGVDLWEEYGESLSLDQLRTAVAAAQTDYEIAAGLDEDLDFVRVKPVSE